MEKAIHKLPPESRKKKIEGEIVLKIDVDTRRGMKKGVPNLLELLDRLEIKASFFLSFGPDTSGRAIFNIFRKKGFLKKMIRTRAPSMYGLAAIFYGTLLPAPMIASAFGGLVRRIEDEGHEVALHAWNHRLWQDHLWDMSREDVEREIYSMHKAYRELLGSDPQGAGAPGWIVSPISLEIQDSLNLKYASDTRMGSPFIARLEGKIYKTIQIPSNQPCIEELVGLEGVTEETLVPRQIGALRENGVNVMPVHAEVEGVKYLPYFERFLQEARSMGYTCVRMIDIAGKVVRSRLPTVEIKFGLIPGRAGGVAVSD